MFRGMTTPSHYLSLVEAARVLRALIRRQKSLPFRLQSSYFSERHLDLCANISSFDDNVVSQSQLVSTQRTAIATCGNECNPHLDPQQSEPKRYRRQCFCSQGICFWLLFSSCNVMARVMILFRQMIKINIYRHIS